jgi:hypothetical protein
VAITKQQSHGRICEAAVLAKCWMHGIPAFSTGGLQANFAGSDLVVRITDPLRTLWVEIKSGYPLRRDVVYLSQCSGPGELERDRFIADVVVFVNLDPVVAKRHAHDGQLAFQHLTYYVVPHAEANRLYREAVCRERDTPKRDGTARKLGGAALHVPMETMAPYRERWDLLGGVMTPVAAEVS